MKQINKLGKIIADMFVVNPLGFVAVVLAGALFFALYVVLQVVVHFTK